MATINPSQTYDIIHELTFENGSGTCDIRLYRGSSITYSGTVYYRAGTSGSWTTLSVSGTSTTFPVSSTTMQLAHDWNKSGNDYMSVSFKGQSSNLTGISISQKAVLSGAIGGNFMASYAQGCSALTTLAIPDTSQVTSIGDYSMYSYAYNCSSLTTLILPAVGYFANNNVDWQMPAGRLGILQGETSNSTDQSNWQALTTSGKTLHTNYIRSTSDVVLVSSNTAPTATDDTATTPYETAVNINVLTNDSDPESDPLTVDSITAQATNGTAVIQADDTITYTPNTGFSGTDSFTYQVNDGNGGTDTATVIVTVEAEPTTKPTVTTQPATNITKDSAKLHGNVTDAGGLDITERGFEISKTPFS